MKAVPGSWATELDATIAAGVVGRFSNGLIEIGPSYDQACEPFLGGKLPGNWWQVESRLLGRTFLATDTFGDIRSGHDFDAMAMPWKEVRQEGKPPIWTPPLIHVPGRSAAHDDVFEHEAIHVAQLLSDYEFPGSRKVRFAGPLPNFMERVLNEFEAYLVQRVYFQRAFDARLILDFDCVESAQLDALRAAFSFLLRQCSMTLLAQGTNAGNLDTRAVAPEAIASGLLGIGEDLKGCFRGTVLESARVLPTLDQLAMHLYLQLGKALEFFPPNDPRGQRLYQAMAPLYLRWSDYEGDNPFEILRRFRPPNRPPRLNLDVM